ncbi:MAG: rhomboid family intramembrane serine protease [Halobacteria archaeon]|nr:rhomboid family intramembrane serine protease [Halobacteria archaeon]
MDEDLISNLVFVFSVSVTLAAVYLLERDYLFGVYETAKERLVWGLPLGTLLITGVNIGFYAFAQRGLWHASNPLVVPYYSWSYSYPLSFMTSPISHANIGHITSNLVATAVFSPVAEYVVGHRARRTRPVLRALGFAAVLYLLGVFTAAFSAGPTVGFSGVVFGVIGFVTVFYPVRAVVLVTVTTVLDSAVSILQHPVVTQTASEEFVTPWWAQISVESHILGFFVGVLGAAALLGSDMGLEDRIRDLKPVKVGASVVVVGVFEGIYALWVADGSSYVLYQSLGLSFALLGGVGAAFAVRSEPPIPSNVVTDRISLGSYGYIALLLPVLVICFVAVGVTASSVGVVDTTSTEPDTTQSTAVDVEGYEISYHNSTHVRRVTPIPGFDQSWNASGVVLTDRDRGIWLLKTPSSELASETSVTFYVGDLRAETRVTVERTGVSTPSGDTAYSVLLRTSREDSRTLLYESPPAPTGVRINRTNVSVGVSGRNYTAVLSRSDESSTVRLSPNSTPRALGVELRVENSTIVASDVSGETRAVVGRLSDN